MRKLIFGSLLLLSLHSPVTVLADDTPLEFYCGCPALPVGTVYLKRTGFLGKDHKFVELGVRPQTNFCEYPYPACAERSCEVEVWDLDTDRTSVESRPCYTFSDTESAGAEQDIEKLPAFSPLLESRK